MELPALGPSAVEHWLHELLRPVAKQLAGEDSWLVKQLQHGFEDVDDVAKSVREYLQEQATAQTLMSCIIDGVERVTSMSTGAACDTGDARPNGKFAAEGDFEFKYGDTSAHQHGLQGVIGAPLGLDEASLKARVKFEHTGIDHCSEWGASHREFMNSNYSVLTTPAREWAFVDQGTWTASMAQPYNGPLFTAPGEFKRASGEMLFNESKQKSVSAMPVALEGDGQAGGWVALSKGEQQLWNDKGAKVWREFENHRRHYQSTESLLGRLQQTSRDSEFLKDMTVEISRDTSEPHIIRLMAIEAKITTLELLVARSYTGPCYSIYNSGAQVHESRTIACVCADRQGVGRCVFAHATLYSPQLASMCACSASRPYAKSCSTIERRC